MAEWHPLPSRDDASSVSPAWSELNERAELRARRAGGGAALPDLRHLTSQDFQHVYEPSDDTYLLMDALRDEIRTGRWDAGDTDQSSSPHEDDATPAPSSLMVVLEVGCGSGVPSVVFRTEWNQRYGQAGGGTEGATNHRSDRVLVSFATDVNPKALEVAQRTAHANLGKSNAIEFVRCDLASPLLSRLGGQVDVLLFNPPYVPTPDDEVMAGCGIEASWAGGRDGRRVVDRFLPQLARLLRKPAENCRSGAAYVITVDDNRPDQLAHLLKERHGLIQTPLLRRRAYNEHLTVQKITWPSDTPQHSSSSSPSSGAPPP
jgi:release factor glutamine methyltransferase